MKRLGIFVFYDKDGIVDRYVEHLLKDVKKFLDELVIVCNGNVEESGLVKLKTFTSRIHIRENTGYDAMAYKLGMTEYCGWEETLHYDEVLMFNDTFFGPFESFSKVFEKMDNEICDFWGLTCHEKAYDYFYGTNDVLPAHVHTFFTVYRRPVLESVAFQKYWDEFDSSEWFFSDVARHEQFFTKYLEDAGFSWKAYVNAEKFNTEEIANNFNHYFYIAYELIKDFQCPIIKRKNFVIKRMSMQSGNTGEDIARALHYIEMNTSYDIDMIWENILRLYNVKEIKDALHLDYVLPCTQHNEENIEAYAKTAVIAHLGYEDLLNECLEYLKSIPEEIALYITTGNENIRECVRSKMKEIEKVNYHLIDIPNNVHGIGALFIGCKEILKQYEYVCFVHDKKLKSVTGPVTVEKSLCYNMWENTLKSEAYIKNIIELFCKNKRLGFLTPPVPIHAEYFGFIGQEWHGDYDNTVELANKLGIKANFSPDIQCFALSNAFWCKTKAIMPLIDYGLTYENLSDPMPADGTISHAIERIYPYVAQSQGYYSGIVMNTDYASLQNTNLYYYLSGVLSKVRMKQVLTDYDSLFQSDVLSYCKGRNNIYIYGAGTDGIKASNILSRKGIRIKGFIISDNQPPQGEKNGYPIYRLSEVDSDAEDIGIIISVGYTRDRREILQNLIAKGYEDYYIL